MTLDNRRRAGAEGRPEAGVPAGLPGHRAAVAIQILQSRAPLLVEQDVHQAWDGLFDGQGASAPPSSVRIHPGAITTSGWQAEVGRAAKLRMNIFSAALLTR